MSVPCAPLPSVLQERCIAAPGLIAQILVSKYADHLPLYRQESIYESRHGVYLPRQSMARWVGLAADWLRPIYDEIRKGVFEKGYEVHKKCLSPRAAPPVVFRIFDNSGSYRIEVDVKRYRPQRIAAFDQNATEAFLPQSTFPVVVRVEPLGKTLFEQPHKKANIPHVCEKPLPERLHLRYPTCLT